MVISINDDMRVLVKDWKAMDVVENFYALIYLT